MTDEDPELEALRQRRLAQLQMQGQKEQAVQAEREKVEAQKQAVLRMVLTPEAKERLGRLKLAYPEMAESIESQLIMLYQSGRISEQIDDQTFKRLLSQIQPKKREINITRK
ncbi:MAG: DNA-binding protein [Thermoplasmatota archaeon]